MPAPSPCLTPSSDLVIPGVWHGHTFDGVQQVQTSGYELLDAQLPGGGWPVGSLCEVLEPLARSYAWQLVLPALAQVTAKQPGVVVSVAPPCEPFCPALQAQGLRAQRLCLVRTEGSNASAAALWAAEQALGCQDVLAVLVWLPQIQPTTLRRLHLAAAQRQQLLWVFRPLNAASQASPAVLRLQVGQASAGSGETLAASTEMEVRILKRRGPPLMGSLHLPSCPPLLASALAAQAQRKQAASKEKRRSEAAVGVASGPLFRANALPKPAEMRTHALDRTAASALEG